VSPIGSYLTVMQPTRFRGLYTRIMGTAELAIPVRTRTTFDSEHYADAFESVRLLSTSLDFARSRTADTKLQAILVSVPAEGQRR
jgi:hypothetical protein